MLSLNAAKIELKIDSFASSSTRTFQTPAHTPVLDSLLSLAQSRETHVRPPPAPLLKELPHPHCHIPNPSFCSLS